MVIVGKHRSYFGGIFFNTHESIPELLEAISNLRFLVRLFKHVEDI